MTNTFLRSLGVSFLLVIPTIIATAQNTKTDKLDEPTIVLDVQVVRQDTGEPVTSLTANDLKLAEDGFSRPIQQISHGRHPRSIVIMVDITKGFQQALGTLKGAMANALEKLGARDEVALLAFGANAETIEGFTRDRNLIAHKFLTLDAQAMQKKLGATQELEKALKAAGTLLEKAPASRHRSIVLLTSESSFMLLPSPSRYSRPGSPEAIKARGTIFGVIQMRGGVFSRLMQGAAATSAGFLGLPGAPTLQAPPVIRAWAERTGGETFATDRDGLSSALIALFDRMRERVTITFAPLNKTMDGSFRRLQIVSSAGLERREGPVQIRVPEGYFAKPSLLIGEAAGTSSTP